MAQTASQVRGVMYRWHALMMGGEEDCDFSSDPFLFRGSSEDRIHQNRLRVGLCNARNSRRDAEFRLNPAAVRGLLERTAHSYQLPDQGVVAFSTEVEKLTTDAGLAAPFTRSFTFDVAPGSETVWSEVDGRSYSQRLQDVPQGSTEALYMQLLQLPARTALGDLAENWMARFGARNRVEMVAARVEVAEILLEFGASPNGHVRYCTQARLPALLLLFGADFFDLFRERRNEWDVEWELENIIDEKAHPLRFASARFAGGKEALATWLREGLPGGASDLTMARVRFVREALEAELSPPRAFLAAGSLASSEAGDASASETSSAAQLSRAALSFYKEHERSHRTRVLRKVVLAYQRRLARRLYEGHDAKSASTWEPNSNSPPPLSACIPDRTEEFLALLRRIEEVQQEHTDLKAAAEELKKLAQIARYLNKFHVRLYNMGNNMPE
eukprot:g9387.t1